MAHGGIGRAYCPWRHAETLGVDVVEQPLKRLRWGQYVDHERTIYLAPGLTDVEARSTLAHEVQHAIRRDGPTVFGGLMVRQEWLAMQGSAALLVSAAEYAEAENLYGPSVAGIARELHVIPEIVLQWRRYVLRAESSALSA